MSIPVIDLHDALATGAYRREEVIKQMRSAAENSGFFYVINHGISTQEVNALFGVSSELFRLPQEQKNALIMENRQTLRGYELMESQTLDVNAKPDMKESFQIGIEYSADHPYVLKYPSTYSNSNPWPEQIPRFREVCTSYFKKMSILSRKIMQLIALSLGLSDSYFDKLNKNPSDTLRLLWYPPHPGTADLRTFGAGSHTDWGAITILAQDANGGLEVKMPNGEWVDAKPISGAFIVNLGDVIPKLTDGRYRSNFHRVINKNTHNRHRQSAAFFVDLDFEAQIVPLSEEVDGSRSFAVHEHLQDMIRKTYGET